MLGDAAMTKCGLQNCAIRALATSGAGKSTANIKRASARVLRDLRVKKQAKAERACPPHSLHFILNLGPDYMHTSRALLVEGRQPVTLV